MGRDKGPLVKGKSKPASSGRSSESVSSAGMGTVTFATLAAGGRDRSTAFIPSSPEPDVIGLDPELALTLRKLGKRDVTTKVKALTQLSKSCMTDESISVTILPVWSKAYCRLALDNSPKVRELGHGLLDKIARSVGRNLGPYTKALVPTWFLSQGDSFPSAALAARNSFLNVFPTSEKQINVIRFSLDELMSVLAARLVERTELHRITFLDGLNRLLQMRIELGEPLDIILKDEEFWNLGVNESALVRRSFFVVLSTLGEKEANRIPKCKLSASLKMAFETEKLEIQSVWNCFLTLTINGIFQEKDVAEAQILRCTSNAFYGHASQVGPLLLPLVGKLGIPSQLFESIKEGFTKEKNTMEQQAIIQTYAEVLCLAYRETQVIPEGVFSFITSQLSSMEKMGSILSKMIQNPEFYNSLAEYCLHQEEVIKNSSFGIFLLSFFHEKPVQFDPVEPKVKYRNLVQKAFLFKLCKGLVVVKNFSALLAVAQWLSGSEFLRELISIGSEIPKLFKFDQLDNLSELRLSLEILKSFPESPHSLFLVSSKFEKFQNTSEDFEVFMAEIEPFDDILPLRRWLKTGVLKHLLELKSQTKYILNRREIFGDEIIRRKLQEICRYPTENLDIAQYFMMLNTQCSATLDLNPFFISLWDAFLNKNEDSKLQDICWNLFEEKLLPPQFLLERVKAKAREALNAAELDRLVEIGAKLASASAFQVISESTSFDSDLLVSYTNYTI